MFKMDLIEETFVYSVGSTGREIFGYMDGNGILHVISDPEMRQKIVVAKSDIDGYITELGEEEATWRVEPDGYIFKRMDDGQWHPRGYVDEYGKIYNWTGKAYLEDEDFEGSLGKEIGFMEPQGGNPAAAVVLFIDAARIIHKLLKRLKFLEKSVEKVKTPQSIERVIAEVQDFKNSVPVDELGAKADALMEAADTLIQQLTEKKEKVEAEQRSAYEELKSRAMELLNEAREGRVFSQIREHLKDFKEILKAASLPREQKDELFGLVQQAFDVLWERQKAWQESADAEKEKNYNALKEELEAVQKEVNQSNDFRTTKLLLIKLQDKIKTLRLDREKREELLAEVQKAFDILAARQHEWAAALELERQRNYETMKKEVENCLELAKSGSHFKEIREHFRSVREKLRQLPMSRDQKDELFGMMREASEILNRRQNEWFEKVREEYEANYKKFNELVTKGLEMAQTSESFKEARDYLRQVRDEMKKARMSREQKDELFERLRAAFDILWERQKRWQTELEMEFQRNFQELQEAVERCITLAEIERDFRYVRDVLEDVYRDIRRARLRREDRRKLIEGIDKAWSILRQRERRRGF